MCPPRVSTVHAELLGKGPVIEAIRNEPDDSRDHLEFFHRVRRQYICVGNECDVTPELGPVLGGEPGWPD